MKNSMILPHPVGMNPGRQRNPSIVPHAEMRSRFRPAQLGYLHRPGHWHIGRIRTDRRDIVGTDRNRIGPVAKPRRRAADRPADAVSQFHPVALLRHRRRVDRRVGKDPGRGQRIGFAVDLGRRPELGDMPVLHQRRLATQHQRFGRFRRGIDHDRAPACKEVRQLVAQFLAQLVVEIGQGFVEEDSGRFLGDGAGEGRALLLAARQFMRTAVEHGAQLQHIRRRLHPSLNFGLRHACDPARGRRCCRRPSYADSSRKTGERG